MRHFQTLLTTLVLAASSSFGTLATAQGPFSPVAHVNDSVVTEFEVEQRVRFLTLLNAPGASRDNVIEELVNERLRAQAVARAGIELSDEALATGKEEFAQRVDLTADEFVTVLQEAGVAQETFDDFVRTGVAWREFIAAAFGRRLEVSEKEIDLALGSSSGGDTIRVLISEIIIPAPEERRAEVEELATRIAASTSESEFSEFARRYSATATRDQGGRMPWQSLGNLPPILRPLLLALAPGDVTEPLAIPDAVALFQLRGIEETGAPVAEIAAIEYAAYFIPGGRSQPALQRARQIRAQIDVCDDLYGIAQGQPPEVLERNSVPVSDIPSDIALELSKLDPGESSFALTRNNGETLVFLMLCSRTAKANEDVARDEVAASLRSSRLNAIAESYLDQLRADSRIRFP
jgi:peptidyl-prolyl cis-trans isomerase SurA